VCYRVEGTPIRWDKQKEKDADAVGQRHRDEPTRSQVVEPSVPDRTYAPVARPSEPTDADRDHAPDGTAAMDGEEHPDPSSPDDNYDDDNNADGETYSESGEPSPLGRLVAPIVTTRGHHFVFAN
jgi:hypothetical protein